MRLSQVKTALGRTYDDVQRKHTMQMAAGLSYYFVMSFFPLLIMFAAVVAYLPIHHLFGTALDFMGRFMPKDSMELVKTVLRHVITPYRGRILSLGIIGMIWAASGGFSSMMEALNIAYDVLTVLLVWRFVSNALNAMRGLVPAVKLFSSFIYVFGCFSVAVFFYVFHRGQS
jgi:uncharacterized BrkB/YihY/UPF0761 family membrane protein